MFASTLLGFILVATSESARNNWYETGPIPDFDEDDPFIEALHAPGTISKMELKRLPREVIHGLTTNYDGGHSIGTEIAVVKNERNTFIAAEYVDVKNKSKISQDLVFKNQNSGSQPTMKNKVHRLRDKTRFLGKLHSPETEKHRTSHESIKQDSSNKLRFKDAVNGVYYRINKNLPSATEKPFLGTKNYIGRRNLNLFRGRTSLGNLKTFKIVATPYTRSNWEPNFLHTVME